MRLCFFFLAVFAVLPVTVQAASSPAAQQSRTRAQIHLDIINAERSIAHMKHLMATEQYKVNPDMDAIRACAEQVARAEAYLRRLWEEYQLAPY